MFKQILAIFLLFTACANSYGQDKTIGEASSWIEDKLITYGYGNSVNEFSFDIDNECQFSYDFYNNEANIGHISSFFAENIKRIETIDKPQEDQRNLTSVVILLKDDSANEMYYRGNKKEELGSEFVKKINLNFEKYSKDKNVPSRVKEALTFIVRECGGKIEDEEF